MTEQTFETVFAKLTGYRPLRWQQRLFALLRKGRIPAAIDLPTGLGKTSVMAIWYLARRAGAPLPRRLVYVVDRRAVVDQATATAEDISRKSGDDELRISTLRGQHVDNREWLDDPAASAIVVGTIDMVGSRLLFEGYGVSRKMRPYHAGLLGADALVVLDEAHLVPPFEKLLEAIEGDADAFGPRANADRKLVPPLRLLSLSATGRDRAGDVFRLDESDLQDAVVNKRLAAKKTVEIVDANGQKLELVLAVQAWRLAGEAAANVRCLVYCNSRETATKTRDAIEQAAKRSKKDIEIELFVGARRIREREGVARWLGELGFTGEAKPPAKPTFLVATSAGEVGVDMDADHLVCDLVPWERMVQRFGRVNRRGDGAAAVVVVDEGSPKVKKPDEPTAQEKRELLSYRSLTVLRELPNGDASPGALRALKLHAADDPGLRGAIDAATTPAPLRPPLSRALVDAWSMTSLEQHTGRPEIEPWLRGWIEDDPPQTTVVWRTHLPVDGEGNVLPKRDVGDFFEAAPPHVSEGLETETYRVFEWLVARAQKNGDAVVFILSPANELRKIYRLAEFRAADENKDKNAKRDFQRTLAGATAIVGAGIGGLTQGMLAGHSDVPAQTADGEGEWMPLREGGAPVVQFRVRQTSNPTANKEKTGWRGRARIACKRSEDGEVAQWLVVEKWRDSSANENDRSVSPRAQSLAEHETWAEQKAIALAKRIDLPEAYRNMLAISARLHDEGKRHARWQRAFNAERGEVYAKTKGPVNFQLLGGYRHEFGSLPFAERDERWLSLSENLKDLALHLIAAHHGFARPVIGTEGCDDAPPSVLRERAAQVALRFSRLQTQWGPWGLAWWEALMRSADQQASKKLEEEEEEDDA